MDLLPEPKTTDRKTQLPKAVRHVRKPTIPLYPEGGPKPEHSTKVALGDCWLIAGLAEMAQHDPTTLIESLKEEDGYLVGRLIAPRGGGLKEYRFPHTIGPGALFNADTGSWVRMWQKLLVYHRSLVNRLAPDYRYSWLDGGVPGELFEALGLPGAYRNQWWLGEKLDRLDQLIVPAFAKGNMVTLTVFKAGRGTGLTESHSYGVDAVASDGYMLKNPTGKGTIHITLPKLATCGIMVCRAAVKNKTAE